MNENQQCGSIAGNHDQSVLEEPKENYSLGELDPKVGTLS